MTALLRESEKNRITLALATRNQAGLLRQFLERYLKHGADKIPLLVIDDGSSDDTQGILREAAKHSGIKCKSIPPAGAARARNEALDQCITEWLAFSDTDCVLDEEYFSRLIEVPRLFPLAVAVEGAVLPPPGPKPPLTHWLENPRGGSFATANMVIRVDKIKEVGGFDEAFPGNLREDTDLGLTLWERFGDIPFYSALRVHHPFIERPLKLSLRQAWRRQADTLYAETRLGRKHPQSYSRVRRLPSAPATINGWCRGHAFFFAKQAWPWMLGQARLGPRAWLFGAEKYLSALLLAVWEQLCLNIHWLARRRKINAP